MTSPMETLKWHPEVDVGHAIDLGGTLPSSWYTDPAIFKLETQKIFRQSWHYVGDTAKVTRPESFFTCDVAGIPVVVVRGRDAVLRAFVNICRHRAHKVALGGGCRSTLQCKYHGWTYRLDGTFNAAPQTGDDPSFSGEGLNLHEVRVATEGNMVFVNADSAASPLSDALGVLAQSAREHGMPLDTAKFALRTTFVFRANWKVVWDNNCECYHCATCHTDWWKEAKLGPEHYHTTRVAPGQYQVRQDAYEGEPAFFAYYGWPTIFFTDERPEHGEYTDFTAWSFVPLAPDLTRLDIDLFSTEPLSEDEATKRMRPTAKIIEEDKEICERVQQAHGADVPDLSGRLVLGIGSERQTQDWARMVYQALEA